MDSALRDNLLAGLTEREIVETVVCEIARRGLCGCVFVLPAQGGAGAFASSSPSGLLLNDKSASEQLLIFADCAATSTGERRELLKDVPVGPKNNWMN